MALKAVVFLSNRDSCPQEVQVSVRQQDEEGLAAGLFQLQNIWSGGRGVRLSALDGRTPYQETASCQLIPSRYLNRGTFPGVKTGEVSEY